MLKQRERKTLTIRLRLQVVIIRVKIISELSTIGRMKLLVVLFLIELVARIDIFEYF